MARPLAFTRSPKEYLSVRPTKPELRLEAPEPMAPLSNTATERPAALSFKAAMRPV
jgi:hypothetical protein